MESQGGLISVSDYQAGKTNGDSPVRQKRVVLAPQGWLQVSRRRSRPNRASGQPSSARRRWQTNPDHRGELAI